MQKLTTSLAVVLAGAPAAVLFFWRRSEDSWGSMWSSAKDSTSEWSDTASREVGKAYDSVAEAADRASTEAARRADEFIGDVKGAGHEAADRAADHAGDASKAASDLLDDVKERTSKT
jgi:hypothetical protein